MDYLLSITFHLMLPATTNCTKSSPSHTYTTATKAILLHFTAEIHRKIVIFVIRPIGDEKKSVVLLLCASISDHVFSSPLIIYFRFSTSDHFRAFQSPPTATKFVVVSPHFRRFRLISVGMSDQ